MVDERKQLNVRIPGDLYHKIELDGREKQQVVTAALELYFGSSSNIASNIDVAKDLEHEREKNKLLENNIRTLEERIKDLQSQNGFLIQDHTRISGQLNRLLMPSPEEITKKTWWQFWKH
jgi:ribosomal protein S13